MEPKLVYYTCPRCTHYPVAGQPGGIAICQNCKERLDERGQSMEARMRQMLAAYSGQV